MKKIFTLKKIALVILGALIIGTCFLIYHGNKLNTGEKNAIPLLKDKILGTQKEPVNLIICWTPLQMVVAEKIIEKHPNEKFYAILMSHVKNEKFEHYFNNLKNKSERAYSFYFPPLWNNKNFIYTTLLELKLKSLLFPKVNTIFLANVDKPEIHTIASSFPNAEIKTFDDGTVNLVKNSHLMKNGEYIKTKFYRYFLSPVYTQKKLRESSLEHFTIFKNLPNIMAINNRKITYLPLFESSNINQNKEIKDTIKILLGTVEKDLKHTCEKVAKKYNIKYTTLHPRQTYKLDGVITLESELIIEDYILQEIAKNPNTQYQIYTFFSGAALTMKDFPNVQVFAVKPSSFPDDYWLSPVYDLFKKAEIPILEFKDTKP